VRRPLVAAIVLVTGLLLLADLLIVNNSLAELADLGRRRGDPVGAGLVLVGIAAVLVAGLRPGAEGASDPAVGWLLSALIIPIGATLFGLLFVSTLLAARRSVAGRSREAIIMVGAAMLTALLLLPLGGSVGAWLATASSWTLGVPIAAIFRGFLIGIAVVAAVMAARTMLGVGNADD
jgi:hypothetical protein